ncbi:MAG: type IV pilus biogenesis protein EbsA [Microcoleaceae cyanobacterium]
MSINQLKPAEKGEIAVYTPYYPEKRRRYLGHAISLYKQKSLEGARIIEGGENIPFVVTWNVSLLPADITRCRMQFDGNQELSYEVMMATYEFVDFLIDVLLIYHRTRTIDFSQSFYGKLLRYD